jgi:hypothetical protein
MKRYLFILSFFFFASVAIAQDEFTVKLWKQPVSTASFFRLDYFCNWKTVTGERRTSLFLSFIPKPSNSRFMSYTGWSKIRIRDRATGKEYKVTDGNGITLRNDAVFAFHNSTDEVGFSLDFEVMPSTVRDIDVYWDDSRWFADVHLDPAGSQGDKIFMLSYLLRTITMYTSVPKNIYFNLENTSQSDLYINRYYPAPQRPASATAAGTITLAFPLSEDGKPYTIIAYYTEDGAERRWQFDASPGMGSQMIVLNAGQ